MDSTPTMHLRTSALSLLVALLFCNATSAQSGGELGLMKIEDESEIFVEPQATFTVEILFDNYTSLDVQAWAYAIEHDPAALELLSVNGYTSSVTGIGLPISFELAEFVNQAEGTGLLVARVLALDGSITLPSSSNTLLGSAEYRSLQPAGTSTQLEFIDDVFIPVMNGVPLSVDLILGPFMSETILLAGDNMLVEGLTVSSGVPFRRGRPGRPASDDPPPSRVHRV